MTGILRIGTVQNFRSVNPFGDKHIIPGNRESGCQFCCVEPGQNDRFRRRGDIQNPKSVFPGGEIEQIFLDAHLSSAGDAGVVPDPARLQRPADVVDRHAAPAASVKTVSFPGDCRTAPGFRHLAEFQCFDFCFRRRESHP